MTKNDFKQCLLEETEQTNDIHQAIYIVDDIMIDGEYEMGMRGLDHRSLLKEDMTWECLFSYGTVLIPELKKYISSEAIALLNRYGFEQMNPHLYLNGE